MQVSRCVGDFVSETESSYYRNLHARLHRVHLLDTVGTLFSNIQGFFGKMVHIQQRLSEISKIFVPYRGHLFCGHPFVGWVGFLFSVSIAVTVYVFPRVSTHVIDILRPMARGDRDEERRQRERHTPSLLSSCHIDIVLRCRNPPTSRHARGGATQGPDTRKRRTPRSPMRKVDMRRLRVISTLSGVCDDRRTGCAGVREHDRRPQENARERGRVREHESAYSDTDKTA